VSADKDAIAVGNGSNIFFVDNATATLTSVASVVAAIGTVTTSAIGHDLLVILNDASASHFGVYDIMASESGRTLGSDPGDTIKLLAIFDHGFSAASYHAPI